MRNVLAITAMTLLLGEPALAQTGGEQQGTGSDVSRRVRPVPPDTRNIPTPAADLARSGRGKADLNYNSATGAFGSTDREGAGSADTYAPDRPSTGADAMSEPSREGRGVRPGGASVR